jgi:cellulose synthase/poly-beta-1,6-N-acetylglucosamine synthase-like glycosyltransferase
MRSAFVWCMLAFEHIVLLYFLTLNSIYLVSSLAAYVKLWNHRRRWTPRELDAVIRSPATPGVSIIAPAYNEQATIVESMRALLLLNYPQFEVICVNDGSKDATLQTAVDAFELVRAPVAYRQQLPSQTVRGLYRSLIHRDFVLIDKENGGRADALNAGLNAARYPLICLIDSDSLLEEHALTRGILPFLESPETLAVGGIIRIANGCRVEAGRVTDVRMPGNWLARFQVLEYLRSFLAGRVAHSMANSLLIISGAFGIFRRDAVIESGGLRHDTIGEDMELVVRLHRRCRQRKQPYRIVFQADPVCWTEVPESLRILGNQRNRWQRGLMQVLSYNLSLIGNPRYGAIGLFALPYYVVFEAMAPLIETAGYLVTAGALWYGLMNWQNAQILFLVALVYGTLISLAAVALEELSFRRYTRLQDLLLLIVLGLVENFGFRQLTTWWRLRGTIDYFRGKSGWGAMTRKGFGAPGSVPVRPSPNRAA